MGHRLKPKNTRGDDGAAIVETALILPIVLLLLIGMVEFGFVFKDWISITTATRAGARVGATAGTNVDADCFILEGTAGALTAVPIDNIQWVRVYGETESGTPLGFNQYRPRQTGDPAGILSCPNWIEVSTSWPSSVRDVTTPNLDIIKVEVRFQHDWLTGFPPFGGSVTWSDGALMRMEPQLFE